MNPVGVFALVTAILNFSCFLGLECLDGSQERVRTD